MKRHTGNVTFGMQAVRKASPEIEEDLDRDDEIDMVIQRSLYKIDG